MNNEAQAEVERLIITIGERWKPQMLAQVRRRMPGRQWQQFLAEVRARNPAMQGRSTLLADVAARQKTLAPSLPQLSERFGVPHALGRQTPPDEAEADRAPRPALPMAPDMRFSQQGGAATAATSPHPPGLRAWQPDAPVEQQAAEALASVAHTAPERLDAHTQSRLATLLDIRIPAVKLYANQAADAVARRYRADAVSIGDKILFRAGKFDPASPAGLGLLGHELTHAAQARLEESQTPGEFPRIEGGQQELAALHNEARVLHHFAAGPVGAPLGAPMPALPAPSRVEQRGNPGLTQPIGQPRLAASDRMIAATGNVGAAPLLSEQQLQQIKDVVYRDLMARIRTEFERGG